MADTGFLSYVRVGYITGKATDLVVAASYRTRPGFTRRHCRARPPGRAVPRTP